MKEQSRDNRLEWFRMQLEAEERAPYTIEKYLRDVGAFFRFLGAKKEEATEADTGIGPETDMDMGMDTAADGVADPAGEDPWKGDPGKGEYTHEQVIAYKRYLQSRYQVSSVNSMLNALNKYLKLCGQGGLCVRTLRQQRRMFCDEQRVLRRTDYRRLVEQADREGRLRLSCILQTLGMTGIRIGELHYLTTDCLARQRIHIEHKGKIRDIVLPRKLVDLLKEYCGRARIRAGTIFVTRYGNPVDRKNVWTQMKGLCRRAGVSEKRVFPHNLRHLFATEFYEKKKDLVRLADYLGHSNLDTTRRYTAISSMQACQRELDLGLLVSDLSDRSAGKIRHDWYPAGHRSRGRKKGRNKKNPRQADPCGRT